MPMDVTWDALSSGTTASVPGNGLTCARRCMSSSELALGPVLPSTDWNAPEARGAGATLAGRFTTPPAADMAVTAEMTDVAGSLGALDSSATGGATDGTRDAPRGSADVGGDAAGDVGGDAAGDAAGEGWGDVGGEACSSGGRRGTGPWATLTEPVDGGALPPAEATGAPPCRTPIADA